MSLLGCQSVPSGLDDAFPAAGLKQRLIDLHRQQARRLEAQGALLEAQREWQLVHALSPTDSDAEDQIRRLGDAIDQQFAHHLAGAERALARSQGGPARSHLLRALALKPDDARAIDLIRRHEAQLAYARLDAAPSVARGAVSEEEVYLADHDRAGRNEGQRESTAAASLGAGGRGADNGNRSDEERLKQGLRHLSRGEYQRALEAFERIQAAAGNQDPRLEQYIAETHRALADHHYGLGVAAFRAARYADAAEQFRLVLEHAPDNHKARYYLSSAESLQKE